jgi:hypothetical protein
MSSILRVRTLLASFLLTLVALVALSLSGESAHAGDCTGVRFTFINKTGTTIRIQSATIKGNDGTWTEDFLPTTLQNNASHTTARRRLNKLDSGATGDFTINYAIDPGFNTRVKVATQTFAGLRCTDDITYTFTLTNQ